MWDSAATCLLQLGTLCSNSSGGIKFRHSAK